MRLSQLERRHADLALQGAAQMALAHAKLTGQARDAATVEGASADAMRGRVGETRDGVT